MIDGSAKCNFSMPFELRVDYLTSLGGGEGLGDLVWAFIHSSCRHTLAARVCR